MQAMRRPMNTMTWATGKPVTFGSFPMPTTEGEYEYDALNRLTQVKQGDEKTSYSYYPNGLRAAKSSDSQTTQYVYLNGQVVEELDGSGRIQAQNIFGNGLILRKDNQTHQSGYYLTNSHGDVTKLVDANSGYVLNSYEYDIWGNPRQDALIQEEMSNPFRYAGKVFDAESGMIYLRARYYDPSVGRFISEDTYKGQVDNPLSLNRYTYVYNNPLRFIDPTGHVAAEGAGSFFGGSYQELMLYWSDKAAAYADANNIADYRDAVDIVVPAEHRAEVKTIVFQNGATRSQRTAGDVPDLGLAVPAAGMAVAGAIKNTGKNAANEASNLFGANGTQVTSKTVWKAKGSKARIDVENPNPGQRPGQIHYQDENNVKYYFDSKKGIFYDQKTGNIAPKKVNDLLQDKDFVKKLNVGLEKYLGEKPFLP